MMMLTVQSGVTRAGTRNLQQKRLVSNKVVVLVVLILTLSSFPQQQQQQQLVGVHGFVVPTITTLPTQQEQQQQVAVSSSLYMSSAPSDSASTFEDENDEEFRDQGYASTSTATTTSSSSNGGMISKLLDLLPSTNNLNTMNENDDTETRTAMNEMIVQLEKGMTTTGPLTSSPLLNGVWELRYVGGYTIPNNPLGRFSPTRQLALFLYSGGYSPGVFAYTLAQQLPNQFIDTSRKSVEITISRSQPRIEASCAVQLFNGAYDGTVKVTANLDIVSNVRFRETYVSTTILGQESPVDIPKQLQYSRDLYITYLDDDLLIVRDSTGVPEILVRQTKQFMKDWGMEPGMMDDMVPPGDGYDADFLN